MTADEEIVFYLDSLLEHYSECELEDCSSCSTLLGIAGSIRERLFSGHVYAQVMIATRRPSASPVVPIEAATRLSPKIARRRGSKRQSIPAKPL
jgi:DNA-binding helix-hairpin-helix protein with protein kinase domain